MTLTVLTVVGARPQFIKAAVVSRELRARQGLREVLVHTGQHYDDGMSAVFFRELDIPEPDHHLGIGSGPHGAQTGRMLEAIEALLLARAPDRVLVYGDTNSTLAGALAAVKLHIPVAHVEAGLRSFNRRMPEEVNRVLTDHASHILFAPTAGAMENLRNEGVPEERMHLVGDVMLDAALHYGALAESRSRILDDLRLPPGGYVLATVHRAENTDEPQRLRAIFGGLARYATELPVVVPIHPRTRKMLAAADIDSRSFPEGLRLVDPVGYLDMVRLERGARLIVTDSGGVQKEAFFHRVPCLTLRDQTEWTELLELGWNRLQPPVSADAVEAAIRLALDQRGQEASPYGDGRAAKRVVDALAARGGEAAIRR